MGFVGYIVHKHAYIYICRNYIQLTPMCTKNFVYHNTPSPLYNSCKRMLPHKCHISPVTYCFPSHSPICAWEGWTDIGREERTNLTQMIPLVLTQPRLGERERRGETLLCDWATSNIMGYPILDIGNSVSSLSFVFCPSRSRYPLF